MYYLCTRARTSRHSLPRTILCDLQTKMKKKRLVSFCGGFFSERSCHANSKVGLITDIEIVNLSSHSSMSHFLPMFSYCAQTMGFFFFFFFDSRVWRLGFTSCPIVYMAERPPTHSHRFISYTRLTAKHARFSKTVASSPWSQGKSLQAEL